MIRLVLTMAMMGGQLENSLQQHQSPDLQFELIAVVEPTDFELAVTLPIGIESVCIDDTFYVELWVTDSGNINTGISSAYIDLLWNPIVTAIDIDHGNLYTTFCSGEIYGTEVDELGGSVLSSIGVAVEPDWARVAYVEFFADAVGEVHFLMAPSMIGSAALGRGVIQWSDIEMSDLSITIDSCGIDSAPMIGWR